MSSTKDFFASAFKKINNGTRFVPSHIPDAVNRLIAENDPTINALIDDIKNQLDIFTQNMIVEGFKFSHLPISFPNNFNLSTRAPGETPLDMRIRGAKSIYHALTERNISMNSLAREGVVFSISYLKSQNTFDLHMEDLKGRRHTLISVNAADTPWQKNTYTKGKKSLLVREGVINDVNVRWHALSEKMLPEAIKIMSELRPVTTTVDMLPPNNSWLWFGEKKELNSQHNGTIYPVPHALFCPTVNARIRHVSKNFITYSHNLSIRGKTHKGIAADALKMLTNNDIKTLEALRSMTEDTLATQTIRGALFNDSATAILSETNLIKKSGRLAEAILSSGGALNPVADLKSRHHSFSLPVPHSTVRNNSPTSKSTESPLKSKPSFTEQPAREAKAGMGRLVTPQPLAPPPITRPAILPAARAIAAAPMPRSEGLAPSHSTHAITSMRQVLEDYAKHLAPEQLVRKLIASAIPGQTLILSEKDMHILHQKAYSMQTHPRLANYDLEWMASFLSEKSEPVIDQKPHNHTRHSTPNSNMENTTPRPK
jgi:hypothetical protein